MRILRFRFYRIEVTKGDQEVRQSLGYLDVIDSGRLSDGCSMYAKAFRLASVEQKTANAVEVNEL